MRVLQLGPFPPPHGGVQANLVAIRDYLRRHGIGCAVINLNRFRRPDFDDIYFPRSAAGVLRLLTTLRYDVLHLHHGGDITLRLMLLWLICSLMPGKRTVMTFHSGGYPSCPAGRRMHRWTARAWILRRFDGVIAVNAEIAALLQRVGIRPDRIQRICPYASDMRAMARELPVPLHAFFDSHSPVLLTVGLLEPEYDLELQIDVLCSIRRRHPHAGLVIAGSGSLERKLREKIAASPNPPDVMLYGDMPHDVTLRAIERSDVFLRTTLYDGDSVAVREALDLKTPVIASENGMRPAGVTLVPPHDAGRLIAAIDNVLTAVRPETSSERCGDENLKPVLALYERVLAVSRRDTMLVPPSTI